jgi:hypothetical protein
MVTTQFVTDAELTAYINSAANELYQILAARRKDWFTIAENETVTSGNTIDLSSALSSRMLHLVGVDCLVGNQVVPLVLWDFDDRGAIDTVAPASGIYRIWYVPEMTLLSSAGDALHWSIPSVLEEFVVVAAVIKCLSKAETDTSQHERELARLHAEVEWSAANRDTHSRISDYDGSAPSSYLSGVGHRMYRVIGSTMYIYTGAR